MTRTEGKMKRKKPEGWIGEQHVAIDDLLPCPFCGGKNLEFSNLCFSDDFSIGCNDCRMAQHCYHTPASARDAWNKRAENNQPNLRKALEEIANDHKTSRGHGDFDEGPLSGKEAQDIARSALKEQP